MDYNKLDYETYIRYDMDFKTYKSYVKNILRDIKYAFEVADNMEDYEESCECIYFSECKFDYDTFLKLKKLVF